MAQRKEKTAEERRADYLKRIRSPGYVKAVKRSMQLFGTYNRIVHKDKIKKSYLREAAEYFADDIRNPVTRLNQVVEVSNDRSQRS